jgi:hypothetical protein
MVPPDLSVSDLVGANDQSRNRDARFRPQVGVGDFGPQPGSSEDPFDVGARVAVAAVPFQPVVDAGGGRDGVFEREDEEPARAQRSCCGDDDGFEVAEIHERVSRNDQIERLATRAQILRQLGFQQLVVDALFARLREHSFGEIDAYQPARIRRHEGAAQSRSAAGVEHVETLRRPGARILQRRGDERRGPVRQSLQLRFEAPGKRIERRLDVSVRRARGDVTAGARGQHVQRDRAVRFFCEPFRENRDGLVDLAQRAMRQRQELSRIFVLRPERDHLAETGRGFPGSLQGVEEDAEIRVRVDVTRIELDGRAIRGFRLGRLSRRPQQDAKVAVGIRVTRIDGDRPSTGVDGRVEPAD